MEFNFGYLRHKFVLIIMLLLYFKCKSEKIQTTVHCQLIRLLLIVNVPYL